jgi:vancomycin resistance protein YoaR
VAAEWTEEIDLPPREGRVRVEDGVVEARMPEAGRRVDARTLRTLASGVLEGRRQASLPLVPAEPHTTRADVEAAAEEVRALIAGPIDVRLGQVRAEISPEQVGSLIRTAVRPGQPEGARLEVRLAPARVESFLEPFRAEVEKAPQPATFAVGGGSVRINRSVPGRELDTSLATEHLLRIAQSPERTGRLPLARVQADFTTKDAKALGIVEEVSSFTTNHAAGEPRVQNIHRAADILDGAVVEQGETFSLNGHLGNRTADRGFVEAPVIYNGEFTTDVGGGVSQLATTTFNAVFFGGYPILEHQAHSFYISRYPMGREATVSWPKPDLIFRNDTPSGLLIKTEYTGSSITVRIYGDRHGRKVTATDPVVTGRSANGFSVRVERIIAQGGKEVDRETFLTFYRAE